MSVQSPTDGQKIDVDERRVEREERLLWASTNPPVGVTSSSAQLWRVFIHARSSREVVASFDMMTDARGWAALGEIDAALELQGFTRTHGWEIGSGSGFVAWISNGGEDR